MSNLARRTRPERRCGIGVGSLPHHVLLALRAPGGMTYEQILARFPPAPSSAVCALARAGLIARLGNGKKGEAITLTAAGRALVDPAGPLARSKTLINYCHL